MASSETRSGRGGTEGPRSERGIDGEYEGYGGWVGPTTGHDKGVVERTGESIGSDVDRIGAEGEEDEEGDFDGGTEGFA